MPNLDTGRISLFFEDAGSGGVRLAAARTGGSTESWREGIPSLATDRRVIAVGVRCAGPSKKPLGAFTLADLADDLDSLLGTLGTGPVDVIGAALGWLVGALLAIRHPARVRRLMV
jgi:pimeloyl-ACP methyl ester carboxylesterase